MTDLLIDRGSETITASMESLLGQAADDFTQRLNRGEQPDIEEYASRYPQIAALLRQVLPALQMLRVPAADSGEAIQPQGTLGDFCIHREIGRGGMGVVYEAEQISLGRRVALKVLPFAAAMDSKQLQRFKNEAHAAAGLQHTNIVPVYFVGCERGVHFYAMQFVEGQTLAALIRDLRQLEGRNGEAPAEPLPKVGSNPLQRVGDRPAEAGHYEPPREARQKPRPPEDLASDLISGRWAGAMLSPGHPSPDLSSSDVEARRKHASPCATGPYVPPTPMDQTPHALTVTPPVGALSTEHSTSRPAFFRTVANLGIQAAEALEHAHSLGVIHRDIKPGNLMVDARGNLWITDFGLAHCQGAVELTMSGDLLGTLRYMSPEQALAQRVLVDQRTDIYSLGATLYELLTLEPAYPATDRRELLRQIAFDDPKPPRRLSKAIPVELETIILKAMEKNPAERYPTAQELADDLERCLKNEPIRAKRPTLVQRFRKWARRHPGVVRTAVGALLAAVLILAVSTVWIAQAEKNERAERKRAELAEADATTYLEKALNAEGEKTDKLWREKLARAEALRRSGRAGRRFESLKALAEATQIARSLNVGEDDILKLRNEAIACMTLLDLQIQPEYDRSVSVPAGSTRVWGDAQFERYATSDDQGNLAIRRILSDQELLRLKGPGTRPTVLHFSPNGRFLAGVYGGQSISRPGRVIIWDLPRREVVFELPSEFVDIPYSRVRWSPDSRRLAAVGSTDFVAIFDVVLRKEIQRFPAKVTRGEFAFHPNGKQLAVLGPPLPGAEKQGFGNLKPVLWLPVFGQEVLDRFRKGWGSPDGASVQIRDVETGALVDQFELPVPVLHFDWGCDGRFIAGDYMFFPPHGINNNVYVWDVMERRMRHVLQAHRDDTTNAAFNHAGDLLASHGSDDTLRLWNPWTGKELLRAESGEGVPEFSPDDHFLLIAENWTNIRRFWRVMSSRVYRQLYSPKDSTLSVVNVAFSPDGRWLAASCNDGVRLWDVSTPKHVAWLSPGHNVGWLSPGNNDSFSFEANGKAIVTRGLVGDFRWPLSFEEDQTSRRLRIGPPEPVARAGLMSGFGRIGRLPASAGSQADKPSGKGEQGVRRVLGGTHLAILRSWREPELVDAATGHKLANLTSPEPMRLQCFAFNPDGTQLAVAGLSNSIELWDLRSIREQLAEMGLDWHLAAYPPATNSEICKPLQVEMQLGHMLDREKYSLVIALFPFHGEAYYQRGMTFVKFGQLAEANADFSMAILLKPDHPEAYYQRGLIHLWADRRREAEADFSRAIAVRPDNAEAYAARANSNVMLAEYPSAVADFSKAIELSGWEKAYDDWRKTDGTFPASRLSGRFCHALARLAAGDHAGYRRVCAALFESLGQSPDPGTAFSVAWTCILGPDALVDPSWVVRLAEKSVEGGAKDFDSLAVLGAAHYRADNFSEALQRLREAYATAGDGQHGSRKNLELLFLAMAHARLGHHQEAREWLEKALPSEKALREDLPWHLYLTFVLLRDEAESLVLGPEAVAEDRRNFAADDPRLAYTLARLGGTLLRTQQPVEAEKVLRECLAIREKKEPDAWTTFHARSLLGEALVAQKKCAAGEPFLVQGYEGLNQRETKIPAHLRQVRLTEALERLVRLYDGWVKPEQADQWRKKLEAHKLKIGRELPPYREEKNHHKDTKDTKKKPAN